MIRFALTERYSFHPVSFHRRKTNIGRYFVTCVPISQRICYRCFRMVVYDFDELCKFYEANVMNARKMHNAIVLPLFIQRYRERIRARNKFTYSRITNFAGGGREGGGRKNRNICNFCNPFESIRNNTYIHVSLNYPNLVGNVQDKYIHARIPRGDVLILSFRTFSRDPRTSVNLTVDLVSDTLLPRKHR